jgi:succinate-acetate transporter protein
MTLTAVGLFLLGFAASWIAGRYMVKGAALVQSGAIGLCGVAALFLGMPEVVAGNLMWGLIALVIYGLIGALIFRSAQGVRERAE